VGVLCTGDQPLAQDLYLTTHKTHDIHPSMLPKGFEPATPAGERQQTQATDRAATGTGKKKIVTTSKFRNKCSMNLA